jgi:prepilin-type N-terminal cleavage/methylation domain-containing protein
VFHGDDDVRAGRLCSTGFTLIELLVVLAVIMTLVLVLTPSIRNSINEARMARARNDCQTIASGMYQFFRDTGFFPLWRTSQGGGPGTPAGRVDLLVSQGNVPAEDIPTPWTTGVAGSLSDQLVTNAPGYTMRSAAAPFGWNGPYFSSQLGADPWGNRYAVNVALVDLSPGAATANGQPKMAVWVLSAGPNGILETPFAASILTAVAPGGDDIGTRIQ